MKKKILIVFAHPEQTSLTRTMVDTSIETLEALGHEVILSDLYGMKWKAVLDETDFPNRVNNERLSFIHESGNAYATQSQTPDVVIEQEKLLSADAVILQFPLWWYGMPAILKGWIERVYAFGFAYGYKNGTNQFRFGEGILSGKRAIVSVYAGGPESDYSARGINGPIEQLLFPLTHGVLFYPGMEVLPTHVVHSAAFIKPEEVEKAKIEWKKRLENLFIDKPIPFRAQNGGDYPDRHVLRDDIDPEKTGILAHIAK
ncbi:NAD(P)H-dependent oxidoreductase [Flavobacterium sp. NRK1]|uniref:NAD(P)H-dependent oxidoreductase n=1 Tax=Flavobacterium sp. NRK1 TaxID=2954929 RepID=UPI0020921A6D|nr:NAD(P)H-dependent oxidoreductase [Flavobacterium sp. NRK1]MCO6147941.1 NAD(P)H-dependent oxidoreductase [Flavobacterium sp. NRK1]